MLICVFLPTLEKLMYGFAGNDYGYIYLKA